jgi:protease I
VNGRVLIVVGDASETLDTFVPYYRLQEAGFDPVIAGPEARLYHTVLHEQPPGWDITREFEGYSIRADLAFSDIEEPEFSGVYYSGGRAPEYLRYDEHLVQLTRAFFDTAKPIATICHGVEIPAYAGCLRGRRVTTVAKCRAEVEAAGATYEDSPCVVDGNLVSGRTYHDLGKFLGRWIEQLASGTR